MKPKIILHIGINKTGTTTIQRFFERNYDIFIKNGLLYPRTGRVAHGHYIMSRLLGFGYQSEDCRNRRRALMAETSYMFNAEIERERPEKILISSEMFVKPQKLETVKSFFHGFDVKVVVYLRRHDAWYESAYIQDLKIHAKRPWGIGITNFVEYKKKYRGGHAYRWLVDRWAELFGKKNIIVRPYEKRQNQPDLITDFLEHTGLSSYAVSIKDRVISANISPPFPAVKLMELSRLTKLPEKLHKRIVSCAYKLPGIYGKSSILTNAAKRQLINENMDDYCYIAREYLGRDDGRLFYDPMP